MSIEAYIPFLLAWFLFAIAANFLSLRIPMLMEEEWLVEVSAANGATDLKEPRMFGAPAQCPECNIPISFVMHLPFWGQSCHRGRKWVAELASLAVTGCVAHSFGGTPLGFGVLLFAYALILLAMIDANTMLLPDRLTLPLVWYGLLFNLYFGYVPLRDSVLGAAAGYLVLWVIYQSFKLATGKEGMGYGDFKLLAAIGAMLGWKVLPAVIFLAALTGGVYGLAVSIASDESKHFPFGPYLSAAGILGVFWVTEMAKVYSL